MMVTVKLWKRRLDHQQPSIKEIMLGNTGSTEIYPHMQVLQECYCIWKISSVRENWNLVKVCSQPALTVNS